MTRKKPLDAAERMRIIDDLHVMLGWLVDRKRDFNFIEGDAQSDTELLMLHRRIASVCHDWQRDYPKEYRVRTGDSEVQLSEQKRSPGDVGASRSAAKEG